MTKINYKQFDVIRDTRERDGWNFSRANSVREIIDTKLDTGDYSIVGYEEEFTIERKFSTAEIANNIVESRFKDVLDRLAAFPHKFMIFEFSFDNILEYPLNSGIPTHLLTKIKIKPNFILSCLSKIQVDYGIPIIYAGNKSNAQVIAETLMRRIAR